MPMRLSFQTYLGLKSCSRRQMLQALEKLCELPAAMSTCSILMVNGLPGLAGDDCFRVLARLLVLNPQIYSINLGERSASQGLTDEM